jgi:hypothetical protein
MTPIELLFGSILIMICTIPFGVAAFYVYYWLQDKKNKEDENETRQDRD